MIPENEIDVLDDFGGFTAITKGKNIGIGTLWRRGSILKNTIGLLQSYDEKSFFQTNNDVTQAIYKVKGYNYPVVLWFDNQTGKRIA